jgi:hypothetical protein
MAGEASSKVPYLSSYGRIAKVLDKIKTASVPERFTQDFLATKLGLAGGSARPLIPYLKRAGLLGPDGTPTELYREFRNQSLTGAAAATAVRNAYSSLYELNEYIHDANDTSLKGAIVQVTGMEPDSATVKAMMASFKALRAFADFDAPPITEEAIQQASEEAGTGTVVEAPPAPHAAAPQLKLGYTINLQLPNTTDVAVFNAIFKSLREHLLS